MANKITNTNTKTRKNRVFKDEDYSSGDGMLTSTWGPVQWHFMHTISFNYPVNPSPEDKKHYRDYILNLKNVLPCKYCRMNLKTNLKALPLTMAHMKNRETFSRYIYDLHEHINKMLNKKSGLSYEDARERYEHLRSRCTLDKPKVFKLSKTRKNKEKGCTEPLYGKKSKCIIKIVPQEEKTVTFHMDEKCKKTRE